MITITITIIIILMIKIILEIIIIMMMIVAMIINMTAMKCFIIYRHFNIELVFFFILSYLNLSVLRSN